MSRRSLLACFLDILPGMAGIYRPRHPERTVLYRYGKEAKGVDRLDYLEFIARVVSHIPSKGWAEMICKVYEVDPMLWPHCGSTMKIISFLTDHKVVDRIINHLNLTFIADKPPPPRLSGSSACR